MSCDLTVRLLMTAERLWEKSGKEGVELRSKERKKIDKEGREKKDATKKEEPSTKVSTPSALTCETATASLP